MTDHKPQTSGYSY